MNSLLFSCPLWKESTLILLQLIYPKPELIKIKPTHLSLARKRTADLYATVYRNFGREPTSQNHGKSADNHWIT